MGNFIDLVGFELKKIIKRKSFIFAMIMLVLMCTLYLLLRFAPFSLLISVPLRL